MITGKTCRAKICAAVVVALSLIAGDATTQAQPNGDTWQNLQEIVKLTQSHMEDDVIVSYIRTSGKTYPTSADALVYLQSQGVSQTVLRALLAAPASAPAPAAVMTAPPEIPTIDYYHEHLTPYGEWIDVPGIGAAWVPAEANNYAWRPYMDAGHWVYTDAGWFWQSDYPWGDMAFHYGRWVRNGFTGGRWAWVPGYDWAPSWVSWREGAGGMGWAPLPWGVEFRVGLGLYWHGALVVDGVDFGLGFDAFVFVGSDHFWGGNYGRYVFDQARARDFYQHSQFHAGYRMEGGHLMAEGLGRDHIAAITHHAVVVQKAGELRRTEAARNFTARTVAHKELTRPPAHVSEASHPEASHGKVSSHVSAATEHAAGASTERGPTTHTTETHAAGAGNATSPHASAIPERETTSHVAETRPSTGSANLIHPSSTGLNTKEPAGSSKLPATKPKTGSTNQAPSVPR